MRLSDSSQLALPKHLLQNDESKRRHSLSSIPTNKTKSHADTGTQDTRRLSLSMVDQNGKRKPSESSDLNDSLSKKVSRSERHKRVNFLLHKQFILEHLNMYCKITNVCGRLIFFIFTN